MDAERNSTAPHSTSTRIRANFEELTAANVSPFELVSGHVIDDQFGPMNVVRCGRSSTSLKMEWDSS